MKRILCKGQSVSGKRMNFLGGLGIGHVNNTWRQGQDDCHALRASLDHKMSSRIGWATK